MSCTDCCISCLCVTLLSAVKHLPALPACTYRHTRTPLMLYAVAEVCPPGTQATPTGACELCAEGYFNHRRNGTCMRCTNHTMSGPDRVRCDACIDGYLQTSDAGQDVSCMACMYGWTWSDETMSCHVDAPVAEVPADQLPSDDSWKELLLKTAKKPTLGAPRKIETVGFNETELSKFGGRFTRDKE